MSSTISDLIGDVVPGAPTGAGAVAAAEPREHWLAAPADPNADTIANGEHVWCPRPGGGSHVARLVPGTHVTDLTLLSLLVQAGWNVRLFGPAGYGKTSLAEAAMVATQAALRAISLEHALEFVSVFNGSTGVRDEAVVGRPVQTPDGRWEFAHAKLAVSVRDGLGQVINEADLLGYTLKALNGPMERAPLSLDAYEPGEPDVLVHEFFRAIVTDNDDPQFPIEQSVRSRLKLELAVFDPDGMAGMTVACTDVATGAATGASAGRLYDPVPIPPTLAGGVTLPANALAVRLVMMLAKLAALDGREVDATLEGELNVLGLDPADLVAKLDGAEPWIPGRREIIAITQAEQLLGTELALRAFLTKCSLVGMAQVAQSLIEHIWSDCPEATGTALTPLAL